MSGQDVKRQVMAALDFGIAGHGDELTEAATDALAPCVVLTREEADAVRTALNELMQTLLTYRPDSENWDGPTCGRRVLPLLAPDADEEEAGDG